ncbi:PTS sugar transporter subunit IIB [Pectinatus frisingensis]|uniref:PTS sugar transporter subunit IIB n=1 Tax=Pectinatus frisingensis TaxID=865 RepID=UPI0015F46E4F|nr:PTS sugar transporter subunit IIB [Pectinatus frisingensis]
MLKVFTVCPQGLGSSMIAKIHVRAILDKLGVENEVETAGIASIVGENFDLIITIEELKDSLKHIDPQKIIFITNFFKKSEIEKKVVEKVEELRQSGRDI